MSDDEKPTFNLWSEAWIAVEEPDGALQSVSLETALLQAGAYRGLYDPSPLVTVGIHRLLVAILQDVLQPRRAADLAEVWQAGAFPEDGVRAFGERYGGRFDLFSAETPFLQSADLPLQPGRKDPVKTVAYLLLDEPAGTAVTHYRHAYDERHFFCAGCAARGLVIIPPFASSGGSGMKPSINGVPPLYVLPGGETLFESLTASLTTSRNQPEIAAQDGDAPWWRHDPIVREKHELTDIGYLHSLTFPARRVRLHPQRMEKACTYCGERTRWGVRTMIYRMGESRPKDAPLWRDPFAAYRLPDSDSDKSPTPARPVEGKAAWREFGALFLPSGEYRTGRKTVRPLVLDQLTQLTNVDPSILPYNVDAPIPFRVVGLRTDMKMKIFEWTEEGFMVPPAVLTNTDAAEVVEEGIAFATAAASILGRTFRQHFKETNGHKSVVERMMYRYWDGLAGAFRNLVVRLGSESNPDELRADWQQIAQRHALRVFRRAVAEVGDDAATLRKRVEATAHCRARLINLAKKQSGGEQ